MTKTSKAFKAQVTESKHAHKVTANVQVTASNEKQSRAKSQFAITIERVENVVTYMAIERARRDMMTAIRESALNMHRASKERGDKATHRDAHRMYAQLVKGEKLTKGFTLIFSDTENGVTTSKVENVHDLFRSFRSAAIAIKKEEERMKAERQREEEEKRAAQIAAAEKLAATLTPEQLELMKAAGLM